MATIVAAAGGGNWTEGASWVGEVAPTAADDAQLDATSGDITIDTGAVCRSIDCTGYTGTLTHTSGVSLTIGDGTAGASDIALKFVAGMTYTLGNATTSAIQFISTSATVQTVDFAGKTTGNVTYNATSNGSWQMTGAHNTGATATVNLTKGTLDVNGQTCSWGIFNSNNANTRTITLGAAAITMTGSSTASWTIGGGASPTVTANTATITLTGSAAGINLGTNVTWAGTTIEITGSGLCYWGTASTVTNLTRTGTAAKTDTFEIRTNATCTGTFTCTGNSDINRINLRSNTNGTARTITAATVAITRTDLRDITGAGAGSWDLSAVTGGSGDQGGNTDITFSTPATQTWSGTSGGNWSTNAWTSRVPLPQDDVVISSAFDASQTVTADMPRLGKSITWSGATGSPTWAFSSTTNDIFGSITLISGMTLSGTQGLTLRGRSSHTLTSAGKTFTQAVTIDAPSGTYTLQDAFSSSSSTSLTVTNGGLNSDGNTMTINTLSSTNSNTRSVTLDSSTISITNTSGGTFWSFATTTNLTFSATGSTIVMGSYASTRTFSGGGLTYGTLTYTVAGSVGGLDIVGANTFNTINFSDATNARTLRFTASTTTTVTNWNVSGGASRLITISSITAATHTLSKDSGTVSSDYLHLTNSIAAGGATWYAGSNSTDNGGNTGWVFGSSVDPISFGTESVAQIASRLAGFTKEVSTQEAIATHLGILPVTKYSVQEMLSDIAGIPSGQRSVQEMIYNNVVDDLSLTEPFNQYSEQLLWTLASNGGLSLDQILGVS